MNSAIPSNERRPLSTGELYRTYAAAMRNEKESRNRDRLLAGGVGGVITSFFMTPFDVVKIRLQAQQKPFSPGDRFVLRDGILDHLCTCHNGAHVDHNRSCEVNIRKIEWYKRPSHFRGTRDAFVKIVRQEGVSSLWSGLYPSIFISIPTVAIYYSSYDVLKDALGYHTHPDSYLIPLVASSSARATVCTLFCPLDVVRTKMQSEKMHPSKVVQCVTSQVSNFGVRSLFLGLKPSLLRDVPFSMIYWSTLERLKKRYSRKFNVPMSSFLLNATVGAVSGGLAAVLTLPFDVIKTQSQIELGTRNFANTRSISVREHLLSIWLKSGTKALFTGIVPRLMRVMPACAIMLSTFEVLKNLLSVHS